jgi:hypothetical protein
MAGDQVAAEGRCQGERELEVQLLPRLEGSEIRPGQGFLGQVETEGSLLRAEEAQADAVDGQAVSGPEPVREPGGFDDQFLAAAAIAAENALCVMIPVNIRNIPPG